MASQLTRPDWLDSAVSGPWGKSTQQGSMPMIWAGPFSPGPKSRKWEVEVNFEMLPYRPTLGVWALIQDAAYGFRGTNELTPSYRSGDRRAVGDWCQFLFPNQGSSLNFCQEVAVFIRHLTATGVGLLPAAEPDPLLAIYNNRHSAITTTLQGGDRE